MRWMRWMRWIFVRIAVIAVNSVKINTSPQFTAFLTKIHCIDFCGKIICKKCGESGECGKKNNSPHFTAFFTKIHREIHRISYKNSPHMISKVYSVWFKFTRNWKDESRRRGLSSWRHAGGQRFETVWGRLFYCKNTENAVKINNSARFTAFTAQRCKKYAVKKIFFIAFLTKIYRQTSTRGWM